MTDIKGYFDDLFMSDATYGLYVTNSWIEGDDDDIVYIFRDITDDAMLDEEDPRFYDYPEYTLRISLNRD